MGVQREVDVGLGRRMRRELQVEPLILCLVQPAPAGTAVYKGRADAEPDNRPAPRGRRGGGGHGRRNGQNNGGGTPAPVRQTPRADAAPARPAAAAAVVEKVQSKPAPEAEMPAGRTRRRRSAAA